MISGVSAVEMWYTRDGRTWQKDETPGHNGPPYVIEVPEEGMYGFTMVARNGIGLGNLSPTALSGTAFNLVTRFDIHGDGYQSQGGKPPNLNRVNCSNINGGKLYPTGDGVEGFLANLPSLAGYTPG